MGIDPVLTLAQTTQVQETSTTSARPAGRPAPGPGGEPSQVALGTSPIQGGPVVQRPVQTYEVPQDIVEVHQDSEIKDRMVIEYMDQAKNLILQIPSDEELSVERGIAQEFEEAAKLRATQAATTAGIEGAKSDGH